MTDFIPASVKAAAERSEALIKGLNGTQDGQAQGEIAPASESEANTPLDPNAAPEKENAPATLPMDKPIDDFETKYRTLQGKYNAEIPRLNDKVRILTQQVTQLTAETDSLRAGKNNNENPNGAADINGRLDPETFGGYGEEFASMAAQVNKLADENKLLKEQIGTVAQSQGKTEHERYMDTVAANVSNKGRDFNRLNADPDFLTWLQEVVPYTGQSRHTSLQTAERKLDVTTTMGIFNEYLDANPLKQQQKQQVQQPKTQATPNFQPGYNSSGSDLKPPMSTSETTWTRQKVSQLYKDKSGGAYKGREAEFKALEADMFAAQAEGRFQ